MVWAPPFNAGFTIDLCCIPVVCTLSNVQWSRNNDIFLTVFSFSGYEHVNRLTCIVSQNRSCPLFHRLVKKSFSFLWIKLKLCVIIYRQQRSWGKVMFLQNVSVILFTGGGVCPIACWDTPPPPWDQRCAPYPPGTIGADTPQCSACWEILGQQAGGTHPTGMQSCFWVRLLKCRLLLIPDVSLISSGNDNGAKI